MHVSVLHALSRIQWTALITERYMITMMMLLCYVYMSGGQFCTDSVNIQQDGNNSISANRLAIIPRLNFTCSNGRITSIIARVEINLNRMGYPSFQVWRPSSTNSTLYNRIGEVQLQSDDQVTGNGTYQTANITLTGNNTIEFQSGDVVGYYHPSRARYRVRTVQTDGYQLYQFDGSPAPTSVNLNDHDRINNNRQLLIQFVTDIRCNDLSSPANGEMMSCSSGRVAVGYEGDTCSFTCNTGYELTGSDTRTCQSNGSWSGSPVSCIIMECPSSSLPMNSMLAESCNSTYQSMCELQCQEGFNGTGHPSYVCDVLSNGSSVMWIAEGDVWRCERVTCPSLINNSLLSAQECIDGVNIHQDGNNQIGHGRLAIIPRLNFTCNGRITGIRARMIVDDNKHRNDYPSFQVWRPSSVKSTIYSKIGEVQLQSDDQVTGSGTYRTANIIFTGNSTIEFQSGDVVGYYHPPQSRYRVRDISTAGYVLYRFDGSSVPNSVNLRNYDAIGGNSRQPLIQFTIDLRSDHLSTPAIGMISCSSGSEGVGYEEDICSFTCNTGYQLTGSDTRTCQSDGNWSGNEANCHRVIQHKISGDGSTIAITAGSVGGAIFFIITLLSCIVILCVKQSQKRRSHSFDNNMVIEMNPYVMMSDNPSYNIITQNKKQKDQYDYVLHNKSPLQDNTKDTLKESIQMTREEDENGFVETNSQTIHGESHLKVVASTANERELQLVYDVVTDDNKV